MEPVPGLRIWLRSMRTGRRQLLELSWPSRGSLFSMLWKELPEASGCPLSACSYKVLGCRSGMLLCRCCSLVPLVNSFPGHCLQGFCEQDGSEQLLVCRKSMAEVVPQPAQFGLPLS